MGKGDMGTKLGTPSPHKQKATGTAEGEEHGMGTQLAFWPQALGSTSNLEGNGVGPGLTLKQPSTQTSVLRA